MVTQDDEILSLLRQILSAQTVQTHQVTRMTDALYGVAGAEPGLIARVAVNQEFEIAEHGIFKIVGTILLSSSGLILLNQMFGGG